MSLNPRETLDTMLGLLGFVCEIKEYEHEHGLTLQIYTAEKDRLLGRNGALLEDIQVLLNRLLQAADKGARKVQVDIEHWREMKDDSLAHRVRQLAEIVRQTGRPYHLEPMNAYERRIVHNAFKDDPEIMTWSPPDDARLKRITLRKRVPGQAPIGPEQWRGFLLTNGQSVVEIPSLFPGAMSLRIMTTSLIDEAFKIIPSQQLLVNVVSRRVRQLTAGHRPMVETGPRTGFSDIALTEIIQGKLNYEATVPVAGRGQN